MLGAGLLWFGWFGFNAGSRAGRQQPSPPWPGSTPWSPPLPPPSAGCSWRSIRDGHATSLGAASGVVAGLVAITPACSAVNPVGALVVGVAGRRALRPGGRPEVPLRRRRLARRRRRPPRGWPLGHHRRRLLRHRQRPGRCRRALLRRRRRPAVAPGRRCVRRPGLLLRPDRWSSASRSPRRSASASRRRTRSRASTSPSTARRATTSSPARVAPASCPAGALGRRPVRRRGEGDQRMKLVTAVIKPHKWEEVRAALEAFGVTGHDRERGQRLRPAEGPHRGLPRCGVRHRPGAEDPHRDHRRRRRRRGRLRDRRQGRADRPHRRRQGLGLARWRSWSASAPATATRPPSDGVRHADARGRVPRCSGGTPRAACVAAPPRGCGAGGPGGRARRARWTERLEP